MIRVDVNFLGDDKFRVNTYSSGVTFYVDKTKENYLPTGPNPLELFLSSLASCVGVYSKKYLTRHNVKYNELKIEAEAKLSQAPPSRLVDIQIKVYTDAHLEDKKEVFLKFIKNCTIHNTIIHTEKININLELRDEGGTKAR